MSDTIIVAIITSASALLVALISVIFSYNKTKVETAILRSQLEKNEAETAILRSQQEKNEAETAILRSQQEKNEAETAVLRSQQEKNEAENQKQYKELVKSTQELKQVTSYKNYKQAFQELEENIRAYLKKCNDDEIAAPTIDLKLIAVAMTFSWDNFILTVIPDLLGDYKNLIINLEILFVSHEHLEKQKIGHGDIDWLKKSQDRINEVKDFHSKYKKQFGKRFNFSAKIYSNLPHWHGWLFNESHLFLGRTSWDIYENNLPILKVGQNKYRHFIKSNENNEASERIELFKNWHKYYFDFASEWVVGNKTKDDL